MCNKNVMARPICETSAGLALFPRCEECDAHPTNVDHHNGDAADERGRAWRGMSASGHRRGESCTTRCGARIPLSREQCAEATAEAKGKYAPLNELTNMPSAPVGFVPKLLIDRWSYIVTLKDYFDVCGFALFSDERGVIYEAHSVTLAGVDAGGASDEHSAAR